MVATGTPEEVAAVKDSYTGQYLKELLGRRGNASRSSDGSATAKSASKTAKPSKRTPRKKAEAAE